MIEQNRVRVKEEKKVVLEIVTTNINNEAQADRDGGENENVGIKDIVKNSEAEAKEKDNVIAEGWQADNEKERKEEDVEKIEEQLVEERGRLREKGSWHQDKRLSHKEDKIPGEFAIKKEKDQLRLIENSGGSEKEEGKGTDRNQKEEDKTRRKKISDKEEDMDRDKRNFQREEDKRRRELLRKKDEEQQRLKKEKKRLEEEEIRWTKSEAKWR